MTYLKKKVIFQKGHFTIFYTQKLISAKNTLQ